MRDLTKWPRLLVKGERITEEQANEVLIRTCTPSHLECNDKTWNAIVRGTMGFMSENPPSELWRDDRYNERVAWFRERWDRNRERAEELGIIRLNYLHTSRIMSSYICGPHGWCDWDGTIGSDNYNIGKWPSEDDVTEEWRLIAQTFPFLDLTAQLLTNEGGYEINGVEYPAELAGEWRVQDGIVTVNHTPTTRIMPFDKDEQNARLLADFKGIVTDGSTMFDRERGVSRGRLEAAVRQVETRK